MNITSKLHKKIRLNVEFHKNFFIKDIPYELKALANPQVVLWYIGCNGLKKSCVDFYKEHLISPILKNSINTTFWLLDLTAWKAFKSSNGNVKKFSSFCKTINEFDDERIKCIKSSDIFYKMSQITNELITHKLIKILKKEFIQEASKSYPKIGIKIKDVFLENCPSFAVDLVEKDASEAYSAFQFVEGTLIVSEIVKNLILNKLKNYCAEIFFILPNDELKYYQDEDNSFREILYLMIQELCETLSTHRIELRVSFISFPFGKEIKHRPYNAPSKILRRKKFFLEDIIDGTNIKKCKEKNYVTTVN